MIEQNVTPNLSTGHNDSGTPAHTPDTLAPSAHTQEAVQQTLDANLRLTNRALRLLSACNQSLIRATDEGSLLKEICQVIVTVGGYPFARISVTDEGPEGLVQSPISAGVAGDHLQVTIFPLTYESRQIGVLAIHAGKSEVLAESELNLLQEMADDVAFGVTTLRAAAEQEQLKARMERLTAQLQQAQRMESIGLLAGGIAHDFNNMLVPILAYAELGSMSTPDTPARDKFQKIFAAAERAAALTRQILAISRRQILQITTIHPNEVIAELSKMLCRLIREDITVDMVLAPDVATINGDRTQIEQVILNLVINACDAMPCGGTLTVETANVELDAAYAATHRDVEPGQYVMLAVSDTGCGMDAATMQRIFEPFFTTKAEGKGTGLGLATVYGIVHQHRGHVWVYSELKIGTTFKVYLPVAQAAIQLEAETLEEQVNAGGNETILVVEDNEQVRQVVVDALTAYGYTVLESASPMAALKTAVSAAQPIKLLLTDVIMPVMNGRQLHSELVKARPEIKGLFMSGYTSNIIMHHGVIDASAALLQKPFSVNQLLRKVKYVLGTTADSVAPLAA